MPTSQVRVSRRLHRRFQQLFGIHLRKLGNLVLWQECTQVSNLNTEIGNRVRNFLSGRSLAIHEPD